MRQCLNLARFSRGVDGRWLIGHVSPARAQDDDHSAALEFVVGMTDRIQINLQIDGHLAHRWQLFTRTQAPVADCALYLIANLHVDRHSASFDVKVQHDATCMIVCIQSNTERPLSILNARRFCIGAGDAY